MCGRAFLYIRWNGPFELGKEFNMVLLYVSQLLIGIQWRPVNMDEDDMGVEVNTAQNI